MDVFHLPQEGASLAAQNTYSLVMCALGSIAYMCVNCVNELHVCKHTQQIWTGFFLVSWNPNRCTLKCYHTTTTKKKNLMARSHWFTRPGLSKKECVCVFVCRVHVQSMRTGQGWSECCSHRRGDDFLSGSKDISLSQQLTSIYEE